MSSISCSARSIFDVPFFTFGPLSFLTYACSNTAGIGLIASSSALSWSRCSRVEHAGAHRRLVRVVREDVPAAEHDVVELGERDVVLDRGRVVVGALAEADVPDLRQRADRLAEAAADRLHAGDERGRDRAHAGQQDAELALGGLERRRLS